MSEDNEELVFWEVKTFQDATSMRVVEQFVNPDNADDYYFKGVAMGYDAHGTRSPFDFHFAEDLTIHDCFEEFDKYAELGAQRLKEHFEQQMKEVKKSGQDIVLPKDS